MNTAGSIRARAWREIADGVFVRRYPVFNVNTGLVLGDGEALAVDTRSSDRQGRELLREISWLTDFPLRTVNTHHHFDHTFGNSPFAGGEIWGQERCARRLIEDAAETKRALAASMPEIAAELEETKITPPDKTFKEHADLDVGGRKVRLYHFGRGHTDNDVFVEVPDVHAVFAGDMIEQLGPPSFGDSYPLDWPGSLGMALDLMMGPVVPGHGAVVERTFAEAQLADLSALADLARRIQLDGGSVSDALPLSPFPGPASREALQRAFSQLAGEL